MSEEERERERERYVEKRKEERKKGRKGGMKGGEMRSQRILNACFLLLGFAFFSFLLLVKKCIGKRRECKLQYLNDC